MTLDGGSVELIETEARPERRTRMSWRDEDTVILREMHEKGFSGGMIAKALGKTRNSVLGRLHRLRRAKLSPPAEKPSRARSKPTGGFRLPSVGIGKPKGVKMAPTRPKADPEPNALCLPLWELADHQCHWPVNEGNPYLFCGHAKQGNGAYCPAHTEKSKAPPGLINYWKQASKLGTKLWK